MLPLGLVVSLLLCGEHIAAAVKVVPMSMRRSKRRLTQRKRDLSAIDLTNTVSLGLYEINISVGTPPQSVTLDIDTGSSDIWMFGPKTYRDCAKCFGGSFDRNQSSTSVMVEQAGFSISYADGTGADGDYLSDKVGLGGATVNNVTVAVATELYGWDLVSPSVMGIGFETKEAVTDTPPYPGVLRHMVAQQLINTRSYSLWLDDLGKSNRVHSIYVLTLISSSALNLYKLTSSTEAATGTLLFGGYDTDKYTGNLTILEIQPDLDTGIKDEFNVAWTSLTFTNSTGSVKLSSDSFKVPALLDSGTSFTYIPNGMYDRLAGHFGAYTNETNQQILVPCDVGEGSLDFGFGGSSTPIVSVPFSELAPLAYGSEMGHPIYLPEGSQACMFGLGPSDGEDEITLGDTFLRSAYVVYELDAKLIAMAQSNLNSTSSNVVEIQAGPDPFGGVSTALATATAVTVTQTASRPVVLGSLHNSMMTSDLPTTTEAGTGQITGTTTSLPGASYATSSTTISSTSTPTASSAAVGPSAPSLSFQWSMVLRLPILMAAARFV